MTGAIALVLCLSIAPHLVPAHVIGSSRLTALIDAFSLLLQAAVVLVVCFGPLLTSLLGEAEEHRVLQHYPISPFIHTAAVYLTFLLPVVPLVVCFTLVATILSHVSLFLWFGAYLLCALLGEGSLLFATVLGRRPWTRLPGWGFCWLLLLAAKVIALLVGVSMLRVNPLLVALLSSLLVDAIVCALCWRRVIARQYKRFLEEGL